MTVNNQNVLVALDIIEVTFKCGPKFLFACFLFEWPSQLAGVSLLAITC